MNTQYLITSGATLCALLLSAPLQAADYGEGRENFSPALPLNNSLDQHNHWKGIGRVQTVSGMPCTGTLIDTRGPTGNANSPAYVLTAGHCISRTNGKIITDTAVHGTVDFNYFADTQGARQTYKIEHIEFSSVQGRDLAIVRLEEPLSTLIQDGIRPLQLAAKLPATGSNVLNVGAPTGASIQTLNLAACTLEKGGTVIEQPWTWRGMTMNTCKGIEPGSSGSPILTRDASQLVAIISTRTQDQRSTNTDIPGYPYLAANANYGNGITFLKQCFPDGVLSTEPSVCELFPAFSLQTPTSPPRVPHAKPKLDGQGNHVAPLWDISFSIDTGFYRYKTVVDAKQCEDPMDYSHAIASDNAHINAQIGPQAGINVLCIVGVQSANSPLHRGLMKNALSIATQLHPAGPAPAPAMGIVKNNLGYEVNWLYTNKEIKDYSFKYGSPATTDCEDQKGYRQVNLNRNVPLKILPLKICTRTEDVAGQQSPPREDILQ